MDTHRPKLRKRPLFIYIIIVCIVIFLHFILNIEWELYIKIILGYYNDISLCFGIISFGLVPFYLYFVKLKLISPKTQKFTLFGPFGDVILKQSFDVSQFYSALYILKIIFQEKEHILSLDPVLILLIIIGVLLYRSINDLFNTGREIFYIRSVEKIVRN